MKNIYGFLILVFLYIPLIWFGGSVMRDRSIDSLSLGEFLVLIFFTLMPIFIMIELDKRKGD